MNVSAHQLVVHFLELPLAKQMEVAVAMGLSAPSPLTSDSIMFHQILDHAKSLSKVDALWTEVESRHPKGEAEPNPFAQNKTGSRPAVSAV